MTAPAPQETVATPRIREDVSILERLHQTLGPRIVVQILGIVLGVLAWWASAGLVNEGLSEDARVTLGIFVLAAWYWTTGAIPPFATAVLVMGLSVFFLGYPADVRGETGDGSEISSWREFVAEAANPVVVLMLGGFVLSKAAEKTGLNVALAAATLKPFASKPGMLLAAVLGLTATLSMWMSNTATAAMMVALVAPIAARMPAHSRFRTGLMLAVPVAANIGGMGTPIGTPPNAIAFGSLQEQGIDISFIGWMIFAIPTVAVLLAVAWAFIRALYPLSSLDDTSALSWPSSRLTGTDLFRGRNLIVMLTFAVTVLLWITKPWTGVPTGAAALIPLVVFTATGVLDRHDIDALEWDILLLIMGGLALGSAMEHSGLAAWMVDHLPLGSLAPFALLLVLAGASTALSTFMSHTAASNLLIPLAIGLGMASDEVSTLQAGVAVALGSSLAMSLPVSTPPNAIAFSTGNLKTADLVKSGVLLGILGTVLVVVLTAYILN